MIQNPSSPRLFRIMRHVPNILTWLRLLASPALYATLFIPSAAGAWTAAALFGLCAWTDVFDGLIARRFQAESTLGRVLDPIADKLLVVTALIILIQRGIISDPALPNTNIFFQISFVAALVILWRELLVAGLREYLSEHNIRLPVSQWAKLKTVLQMFAITFLLAMPPLEQMLQGTWIVLMLILWLAAILSITTAIAYVRETMAKYRSKPAQPEPKRKPTRQATKTKARKISMRQ